MHKASNEIEMRPYPDNTAMPRSGSATEYSDSVSVGYDAPDLYFNSGSSLRTQTWTAQDLPLQLKRHGLPAGNSFMM